MTFNTTPWWQHGIIYQIYPRSFKDSNWLCLIAWHCPVVNFAIFCLKLRNAT